MKNSLFVVFYLFLSLGVHAQKCTDNITPSFKNEEKLHYTIHYNWGLIWFETGEVVFEAKDTTFTSFSGFVLSSHGTSKSNWDWFYHVDSKYESWTDSLLNPFYFTRKGEEGPHYFNNEYIITENKAVLNSVNVEGDTTVTNIAIISCTFDVMSAIYYCRSIPFKNYNEGDIIPLNMFLDGEFHKSQLRYIGQEKWTNPQTDKTYDCILFKPLLISGSVFESGENMTVYVTNDEQKTPVYIETNLKIGKAKVFLNE